MEETKQTEKDNTLSTVKETSIAPVENAEGVQETEQQINWKKFREAREIERKEKLEVEKRAAEKEAEVQALKAAMQVLVNKPEPNTPQINYETEETEEQRIARIVEASLEKERRKYQIEASEKEKKDLPAKLTQNHPDFDSVCTSENLDYFEYHYPEVADAYKYMPEGFDKWSKIYKAVKRFVPQATSKNNNQAVAEKNLAKPQSMSIPGKTSTGDSAPQYLDEKRKADNWQRMQRAMKGGA